MAYSGAERTALEALPWEGEIQARRFQVELDIPDNERFGDLIDRLQVKNVIAFEAYDLRLWLRLTDAGRALLSLWNVGAGTCEHLVRRCYKCGARLQVTTIHNGASMLHCFLCDAEEATAALIRDGKRSE